MTDVLSGAKMLDWACPLCQNCTFSSNDKIALEELVAFHNETVHSKDRWTPYPYGSYSEEKARKWI